jgi:hypothetical protein
MVLFSKKKNGDQVASIEAELADLKARHATLTEKLTAATAAVERTADDRRKFLIEGDLVDDTLRTEINVRLVAAQSAELCLQDALRQLGAKIGDAEQRLAAERDRVAREAEAKAINVDADTLATAIAAFDQAGKAMVAALGPLAARLPGVDPNFVPRLSSVTGDLGTAASELVTVARAHAARVVAAGAPIISPRPPEPPAPPPVVFERREVYALQPLKWREPDGSTRCVSAFGPCSPPVALAELAVARNWADLPTSERVAKLRPVFGNSSGAGIPEEAADLNTGVGPPPMRFYPPLEEKRGLREIIGKAREGVAMVSRNAF